MGGGTYSFRASTDRSTMYKSVSREQIFKERRMNSEMDPENTIRECCNSEEHPNTIPVIIALDVTGSMGSVPESFIRDEMTKMMSKLYESGLKDTQVLFLGIGDHECDSSPLQVGQFEASDQLLDKWLKQIYLEGGGGVNAGESYLLAWYYGSRHTRLESFINQGTKGFIFTIGDEPTLKHLPANSQRRIFGNKGQYSDVTADDLLKEASEKFDIYHFHTKETYSGARKVVQDDWKQLLADNCLIIDSHKEIAEMIAEIVSGRESEEKGVTVSAQEEKPSETPSKTNEVEEML